MNDGIEWQTSFVSNAQLKSFRTMGDRYDFGLMCILKSDGAPILGVFSMRPDMDNYFWEAEPDPIGNGVLYRWCKRGEYLKQKEKELNNVV